MVPEPGGSIASGSCLRAGLRLYIEYIVQRNMNNTRNCPVDLGYWHPSMADINYISCYDNHPVLPSLFDQWKHRLNSLTYPRL